MIFKYHISSDTVNADDTTLILDGSEKSLSEAVEVLNLICKVSGLKLNSKKTETDSGLDLTLAKTRISDRSNI